MALTEQYKQKQMSIEECLGHIQSDDVVFLAGDGNCPLQIGRAFHTIAPRVTGVKVFKDFTNYFPFPTMKDMGEHIFTEGFFFGRDMREGLAGGNSSYFPADICMSGSFMADNHPTVFAAAAAPMDTDGNFQIGLCNMGEKEVLQYVIAHGGRVLLEVDPAIPRVRGGLTVHIDDVTAFAESDLPLTLIPPTEPSPEEKEVAANVRSLIRDGDCVQFGIGSLPNAIAESCMDLQDLGMHTEMLTTAMARMVRNGVITGKKKNFHPQEHLFTFAGGDQEMFDTLREEAAFRIVSASYGCDPFIISQNDNMVSVNTCIEVDLTGQIASEAIGVRQYSGSGGALCYAYGALRSRGGRGIMAFTSKTAKGYSKIKSILAAGTAVTIPRNYADYIVTEYGIAHLRAKSVRERAQELIRIAHPDFRKELEQEARKLLWI